MTIRILIAGSLLIAGAAEAATIPASLAVPDNGALILGAKAKGVQIYLCGPDKDDPSHMVWSLKAPEASLFDAAGTEIGKHFGGPSWSLNDGSLVTGQVAAKESSPVAGAIPWLLVKVASNNDKGAFSHATYIQRIDTQGGAQPTDACTAGQESRVAYSATYQFYGTKP